MSNTTNPCQRTLSDKYAISRAFNSAAKSYDSAALLQREIGQRLLERLDFIHSSEFNFEQESTLEIHKTILDLGCGTGFFSRLLAQKFLGSHILSLDLSFNMLTEALKFGHSTTDFSYLCADAEQLPIGSHTIDITFSNCTLQWCNYGRLFAEVYELLKSKGIFLFSTFGPDTLMELRSCFKSVDNNSHINDFSDMHPIGDALLKSKFLTPVLDREIITLYYSNAKDLLKDLKLMGANYVQRDNFAMGLMGKQQLNKIIESYECFRNQDNLLPASFEIIYGYATKK